MSNRAVPALRSTGKPPRDENNHAPNESTKVSLYLAGIRSGLHLIEKLGTDPFSRKSEQRSA